MYDEDVNSIIATNEAREVFIAFKMRQITEAEKEVSLSNIRSRYKLNNRQMKIVLQNVKKENVKISNVVITFSAIMPVD